MWTKVVQRDNCIGNLEKYFWRERRKDLAMVSSETVYMNTNVTDAKLLREFLSSHRREVDPAHV